MLDYGEGKRKEGGEKRERVKRERGNGTEGREGMNPQTKSLATALPTC